VLNSRPVGFERERVPLTTGACFARAGSILVIGFELPGEFSSLGLVIAELIVPTEEVKMGPPGDLPWLCSN